MNTQELRQNIEKVLGNNIRCLLPSYWWKKLFNQVVDTVEDNALPIVKSEEDLKNLEVPEGSIASVIDSIVWKSFASFKLPSPSNATSLLSYPHIQKINVTNAPITVTPKAIIVLTDMQYMSQQNGKLIALGVEDDSVMGYGYSIVGGDVSGLIGPYTFRSAYSNNVNTTAVNALNSILSTSVFRFIGFEFFSGNSDDEQADINQLCSIFTWGDASNGVYVKDEKWQRLALTTELPDISGITNIQVDDTMSSSSINPVQNKVITEALNNKVDKIQGKGLSSEDFTTEFKQKLESLSSIESVTWSELKTLRDSSTLSPGTLYRITDYVTTTSQPDTRSSGYGFDVVVLATSVNTLLEEAFVVKRDDDVYFTEHNSNLNAWKIWYCLDNDVERFAWASDTGKGVVYRMIDEFGNDCPYDFKNIQFKRKLVNGILDLENGLDSYVYTFNLYNVETNINEDYSLKEQCHDNIIKLYPIKPCFLSNNVFLNLSDFMNYCDCNSLEIYCLDNTFGDGCRYNKFNEGCSNNIFGPNCVYNIFDYSCYDNVFSECHSNIIQNNFANNKCGIHFYMNTIGAWCLNNLFGEYFNNNIIGNGCCNNIFGESMDSLSSEVCGYHITDNIHDKVLPLEGAREYDTKVSLNSNGEVKIYCEADLIE
jgi:hypothetical protein